MPRRSSPWIWLALLVLAIAGGLVALLLLQRDDENAAAASTTTVATRTVPAVVGMNLAEGFGFLEAAGYEAQVEQEASSQPAGRIIRQEPEAGAELEPGQPVFLTISTGGGRTTPAGAKRAAAVPDVVGRDQLAAGSRLEQLGFAADSYAVPSDEALGTVVGQDPDPGRRLELGATVRLNVSRGRREPALENVPDVTGAADRAARDRLREARFTVRTVSREAPTREEVGEVILQEPPHGAALPLYSQITIYVGR
jgi:eukaryotic-like serine/threonine-protein kinase